MRRLKLEVSKSLDDDDALFLQLQRSQFPNLREISCWDMTVAGQPVNHILILEPLFRATKIRNLEIINRDQSTDLAPGIANMGSSLKALRLNHLSVSELQLIGSACPNINHLALFKTNFLHEVMSPSDS